MLFDVFYETGIKNLFTYSLTYDKPEFLYTVITILSELFIAIRQDLHGTVTDVDQIHQHFYPMTATQHITAEGPESFLLPDRKKLSGYVHRNPEVLLEIPC